MSEPLAWGSLEQDRIAPEVQNELKTLAHTLALFELLRSHPDGLGITRMAALLGLSKSAVFRIASTLRRHGYLDQPSGRGVYRLGLRLWELGCAAVDRSDLRRIAHSSLEELAAESGEAAVLTVLHGRDVVVLDRAGEFRDPSGIGMQMGSRAPAHCTASGKVLLAHLPPERQLAILSGPLPALSARTITDPAALRRSLEAARAEGVAVADSEFRDGVTALAAPVFDHAGLVLAAVAVVGPSARLTPPRIAHCTRLVRTAAARLGRCLSAGAAAPLGTGGS